MKKNSLISYEQFVQKVRSYSREEVIVHLTHLVWKVWDIDEKDTPHKMDHALARSLAPRVIAIAAATGNNFHRKTPQNLDLMMLCRESLGVKDSVSCPEFLEYERKQIFALTMNSLLLQKFNFDPSLARDATPFSIFQRVVDSQSFSQGAAMATIIRRWIVFKILDKQLDGAAGRAIQKIVHLTPLDCIRSSFALFSLFEAKERHHGTAFMDLENVKFDDGSGESLQINRDTLKLIASRLSITLDQLKQWHQDVRLQPEPYRKYFPLPFYSQPLIYCADMDLPFHIENYAFLYACPCPHIMMNAMATFLQRILLDNREIFNGKDLLVELGDAMETYLEKYLPEIRSEYLVTRVSRSSERSADFIVETKSHIMIIECKKTIGTALSRTMASPEGQVKVWEKITGALEQCAETASRLKGSKGKPIICFILTDDKVTAEAPIYNYISERSGLFRKMKIEYAEIMSVNDFELIFSGNDADLACQESINNWKHFRSQTYINTFTPLAYSDKIQKSQKFDHLDREFASLFPGVGAGFKN
jgi:hypothetical protein